MIEDSTTKEQIYIAIDPDHFPEKGFDLASQIANAHEKNVCFLHIAMGKNVRENVESTLSSWCTQHQDKLKGNATYHIMDDADDFTDFMERNEAAAIIFELTQEGIYRNCKSALKICRELRIPYYFIKSDQTPNFKRVLVPVGNLVEEREKGVFCSGMGRTYHSEILLMTANDYGSRAKQNTEAIQALMDKQSLPYQFITAKKDSFKIEMEAMNKVEELNANLLLISASRDYGMDDIIFGPKEQKIINRCTVPVMVINPRKDLYALCT
ncbi:MAG: hypothetical protein IK017_11750 [Paludibacteraceae bacterium]|nr:hypothetical protein [Paludibacteraceae bacterium]